MDDAEAMGLALAEAERAGAHGDVPVGAVILDPDGSVVAAACNERQLRQDPTAHAEIIALQSAARQLERRHLVGTTLYVTLEPCPMCAGALVLARVARLVYGARDPKAGAAYSLYNIVQDPRLNHEVEVTAGIREEECAALLTGFFQTRRP